MARTLKGNCTGRAAHGEDDINTVTDYSLKSVQYYLDEIAIEEEYVRAHPDHPQRWEAQAVIDECRRCLALIEDRDEQVMASLQTLVQEVPPEPETVGRAVSVASGTDPLDCEDWPGQFEVGSKGWFDAIEPIPFE